MHVHGCCLRQGLRQAGRHEHVSCTCWHKTSMHMMHPCMMMHACMRRGAKRCLRKGCSPHASPSSTLHQPPYNGGRQITACRHATCLDAYVAWHQNAAQHLVMHHQRNHASACSIHTARSMHLVKVTPPSASCCAAPCALCRSCGQWVWALQTQWHSSLHPCHTGDASSMRHP